MPVKRASTLQGLGDSQIDTRARIYILPLEIGQPALLNAALDVAAGVLDKASHLREPAVEARLLARLARGRLGMVALRPFLGVMVLRPFLGVMVLRPFLGVMVLRPFLGVVEGPCNDESMMGTTFGLG